MTERTCGTCYVCCTQLGIEELHKWPGQSCKHLSGVNPQGRCSIYPTRPVACQKYLCGWRMGLGGEEFDAPEHGRPDLCGFLVTFYKPEGDDPRPQATIHIVDVSKCGEPLSKSIVQDFIEQLLPNIAALKVANLKTRDVWLFMNGIISAGKQIKSESVEDLRFLGAQIGRYYDKERPAAPTKVERR